MRYLKAIGLAAMAALMASAMLASAAQAQEHEDPGTLTVGQTPNEHEAGELVGEQYDGLPETEEDWNFFSRTPGTGPGVTCDEAFVTANTAGGTETELSVDPEYIHCQAGGQPATVNMNGCQYTLEQPTTEEPLNDGEYTGTVDLVCPENAAIEVGVYLFGNSTSTSHAFKVCTIEVTDAEEQLGGHVIYKNIDGEPDHVTAAVDVNEITVHDGCESGETHTNGVYKQTLTIGTASGQDVWISD